MTTNEFVRLVIGSVIEDLENNFNDYASIYDAKYNEHSQKEYETIEKWKSKIFNKINSVIKKEDLIEKGY